jgi:hypothetical protein
MPLTITASTVAAVLAMFQVIAGGTSDVRHRLDERAALETRTDSAAEARKEALEVYLVGLYGDELRSDTFWTSGPGRARESLRPLIQRMLDERPSVSSADLSRATEYLGSEMKERSLTRLIRTVDPTVLTRPLLMQLSVAGALAMASSVICRGGLVLWLWGIAVATTGGGQVSRVRALGRTIVAWLPIFAGGAVVVRGGMLPADEALVTILAVSLWIGCALYAIARPARGVQDLVAGTWLVPR